MLINSLWLKWTFRYASFPGGFAFVFGGIGLFRNFAVAR